MRVIQAPPCTRRFESQRPRPAPSVLSGVGPAPAPGATPGALSVLRRPPAGSPLYIERLGGCLGMDQL